MHQYSLTPGPRHGPRPRERPKPWLLPSVIGSADSCGACPGLIEELEEFGRSQARLPQDRRQRAALHDAVLRDDGHPPLLVSVHRVAALGPHIGEADRLQRPGDLPYGQVRKRGTHAAGRWNEVTSDVAVMCPAGSSTSSR